MADNKRNPYLELALISDFADKGANYDAKAQAERLHLLVERAGSRQQLSRQSGVPKATLDTYLAGSQMKLPALVQLALACKVSPAWLAFGMGSDEERPPPATSKGDLEMRHVLGAFRTIEMLTRVGNVEFTTQQRAEMFVRFYGMLVEMDKVPDEGQVDAEAISGIVSEMLRKAVK